MEMLSMASGSMGGWFRSKLADIEEIIHDTADSAASEGETLVKTFVENRGTAKSGKKGRIETGAMRDAVSGKVTEKKIASATAEFGWLEGLPSYTTYQEFGFDHTAGFKVEGMYTLADAKDIVTASVEEQLKRKLRDL